ncbi:MAG: hypothetical protein KDD56_07300 [Bdellovibrionales bacterium]|nr:hypothetical protein [Bdellovibrionales bacterium]
MNKVKDFLSYNEKISLGKQKPSRRHNSKQTINFINLKHTLSKTKFSFTLLLAISTFISFPNSAGTEEAYVGPSLSKKASSKQMARLQDFEKPGIAKFLNNQNTTPSPIYPEIQLERVNLGINKNSEISLFNMPKFTTKVSDRFAGRTANNRVVLFSPDTALQLQLENIIKSASAPHTAVVAMEPKTGRILAVASKSTNIKDLALHAGFPAASLFKIITSAAAIEWSDINENSKVFFRGGNYTLNKYNYLPNSKLDNRSMTLGEALGKSCNPVFARVALNHLNSQLLETYAENFGFNSLIPFDVKLPISSATIPDSKYGLSRTAAGFGEVFISPVHAAAMMSAISNNGLMPRPKFIDSIVSDSGQVIYNPPNAFIKRITQPGTSKQLLKLMHNTTTTGTSRKEFADNKKLTIPNIDVVGKTGTLRGKNPWGLNTWFIGAAPMQNPTIAIAVISVDPKTRSARASGIARQVLEKYFRTNKA